MGGGGVEGIGSQSGDTRKTEKQIKQMNCNCEVEYGEKERKHIIKDTARKGRKYDECRSLV